MPVVQAAQQAFNGVRQWAGIIQHEQTRAVTCDQFGSEPRIARQALLDIRQRLPPTRNQTLAQHRLVHRQQQYQQGRITLAGLRQVGTGAVDQNIVAGGQPIVDVGSGDATPVAVLEIRAAADLVAELFLPPTLGIPIAARTDGLCSSCQSVPQRSLKVDHFYS